MERVVEAEEMRACSSEPSGRQFERNRLRYLGRRIVSASRAKTCFYPSLSMLDPALTAALFCVCLPYHEETSVDRRAIKPTMLCFLAKNSPDMKR